MQYIFIKNFKMNIKSEIKIKLEELDKVCEELDSVCDYQQSCQVRWIIYRKVE